MKFYTQKGFTLLELLITMCIIMILAGIAIPSYKDYKKKAYNVRALSDLKNISTAEELYYIDNEKYFACKDSACTSLPSIKNISQGVKVTVTVKKDSFTHFSLLNDKSGSCAVVALIVENICYIANVGDSRCLISMNKGKDIRVLTTDHKPN